MSQVKGMMMMMMTINDDHEGQDIWQVLNSESFLIMKIINKTKMIELSVIRYQNHHGKKR